MSKLAWVSGPVHTGKTTRLAARVNAAPVDYCGILAPVDAYGQRYLRDVVSEEQRLLSCTADHPNAIAVGPYHFSTAVFSWAQQRLREHHLHYPDRVLLIDEIGKLELIDSGLAPICWQLIDEREKRDQGVLIVVRDTLVDRVRERLKH